jgi:hypothetical protein
LPVPFSSSDNGRRASQERWDRERSSRLVERIRALVEQAPPLSADQKARLAALLGLPCPPGAGGE